jgi:hypothetical protein
MIWRFQICIFVSKTNTNQNCRNFRQGVTEIPAGGDRISGDFYRESNCQPCQTLVCDKVATLLAVIFGKVNSEVSLNRTAVFVYEHKTEQRVSASEISSIYLAA